MAEPATIVQTTPHPNYWVWCAFALGLAVYMRPQWFGLTRSR